jgi:hypothetical protein
MTAAATAYVFPTRRLHTPMRSPVAGRRRSVSASVPGATVLDGLSPSSLLAGPYNLLPMARTTTAGSSSSRSSPPTQCTAQGHDLIRSARRRPRRPSAESMRCPERTRRTRRPKSLARLSRVGLLFCALPPHSSLLSRSSVYSRPASPGHAHDPPSPRFSAGMPVSNVTLPRPSWAETKSQP